MHSLPVGTRDDVFFPMLNNTLRLAWREESTYE